MSYSSNEFTKWYKFEGSMSFLTILGYTMIAIMAAKCSVTYNRVLETISGIREVVYADGYHAHVEYTKEERELMEKLKIEL